MGATLGYAAYSFSEQALTSLAAIDGWLLFHIIWMLWRYVRLIVHVFAHWTYKSKPIPSKPSYTHDDVTVVIPTIHNVFEELRPSLESILACHPHEMILVTTGDKFGALQKLVATLSTPEKIRVESTAIANKRLQVCEALPLVKTEITIMADDDVTWPTTLLPWILAPFEDPEMGGVGTCQRVRRDPNGSWSDRSWNWLGVAYIERRNFEISATHRMDGGTSCMSGRTGAYRTAILSSQDFLNGFKTERWGNCVLNADDDNFVTRWLVSHQYKTWIQYEIECEIETTLEYGMKFLYQCSRWARSNWRSNWTSLVKERYVLTQQPWCTYALHLATFTSLAWFFDPLILFSFWWGTADWNPDTRRNVLIAEIIWMFGFTKFIKLVGLFRRDPRDVMYLPLSILFGYFHGFIKLYALATLNMTSWGSRPDGDLNDSQRMSPRPRRSDSMMTPLPGASDLKTHLDNVVRNRIMSEKAWREEQGQDKENQALLSQFEQEPRSITAVAGLGPAASPCSPFSKNSFKGALSA